MAKDKLQGSKLPDWADRSKVPGTRLDTSTYEGIVKNNVDMTRSGRLQVWIPDFGASQSDAANENDPVFWRTVRYASPFWGETYQPITSDINSFENNRQTYGFWGVPPDIGVTVLCTFINGDPNRGYWFACVPKTLSHTMVPSLGRAPGVNPDIATDAIRPSLLESSDPPQTLPAAEFNEKEPGAINSNFYENEKPIHEFQANVLFNQGLDRDKIRGSISSSSQRESPSRVLGISTPGRPLGNDPADDPDFLDKLAAGEISESFYAVRNRKGGHTFVMDDGDLVGNDQLMRLRTAGGHQILMSDSEKLMYIANSEGSVWIELAESGHMHIYTSGGFNLHTEGDYNVHAGKNINLHADGAINLSGTSEVNASASRINVSGSNSTLLHGGRMNIGADSAMNIGGGVLTMTSDGALKIEGSMVDINSGAPKNEIKGGMIKQFRHSDTGFDEQTRLWVEYGYAAASAVTVLPQHEPWTRTSVVLGSVPKKEVSPPICPPMNSYTVPDYTLPPPNGNTYDRGQFRGQPAPWTTDEPFLAKVKEVAANINSNYLDLLACMNLESARTFDPWIINSLGYVGLIQFGKAAAKDLGTTTTALRNLTRVEQCEWVQKYFEMWKSRKNVGSLRLVDMYLTILWPAAVGKPTNYIVFPSGSSGYRNNSGFDPGGRVGYVTVGMISDSISSHLAEVKQALANAAAVPDSAAERIVLSDGKGDIIAESTTSNTAEKTKEDVGIKNAAGQAIESGCPAEWLGKEDAYNPPSGLGSSPKFTQLQVKAMVAELGHFESEWDYNLTTTDGSDEMRLGKFQVDAPYLVEVGYIKHDAIAQYGVTAMSNPESWTGKDDVKDADLFVEFTNIQDEIQFNEFVNNYAALKANGGIKDDDNICIAAGMLFVAHQFRSVDRALEWRNNGNLSDVNGISGEVYFNHGRYSIDVLAERAGEVTGAPGTDGIVEPITVDIDPDSVFIFSANGTGTRERFDLLRGVFKNALLKMGQEYKKKTSSKIRVTSAYRSQADQDLLIARWTAAGGNYETKPTAAGITTPARTVSNHSQGIAIDSSEAATINNTLNLSEYGLIWGGNWTRPDRVHIQLANAPQDIPSTASEDSLDKETGVVVFGDGIAGGVAAAMAQLNITIKTTSSATATASSVVSMATGNSGQDVAVISVGSFDIMENDPDTQTQEWQNQFRSQLEQIRSAAAAKRFIWILPNFSLAKSVVSRFAISRGDESVSFAPSRNGIHPLNYAVVARIIKGKIQ